MISVNNICKTFRVHQKEPGLRGSIKSLFHRQWIEKHALKNISFDVAEGEIVGLIGSNGAGKTTIAKVLAGIIHPTSGSATVLGHTPWKRDNEYRRQMSLIMGQKASLWWDLPALDCYQLLKEIYQINHKEFNDRLFELSTLLGVTNQLRVQVRKLSLGERMKVELIAALLHRPKVIFLDEPTIGLDFTAQQTIRDFLLTYSKEYKPAVILTSHYMEDIEKLCNRVIILKEGEIKYNGELKDINRAITREKIITAHFKETISAPLMPISFPREYGEILEFSKDKMKIKTSQSNVSEVVAYILPKFQLHDISIEEADVTDVIEKMLLTGKMMTGEPIPQMRSNISAPSPKNEVF